jgi:hypothetical protein
MMDFAGWLASDNPDETQGVGRIPYIHRILTNGIDRKAGL